jgi:hypothetical protein
MQVCVLDGGSIAHGLAAREIGMLFGSARPRFDTRRSGLYSIELQAAGITAGRYSLL